MKITQANDKTTKNKTVKVKKFVINQFKIYLTKQFNCVSIEF